LKSPANSIAVDATQTYQRDRLPPLRRFRRLALAGLTLWLIYNGPDVSLAFRLAEIPSSFATWFSFFELTATLRNILCFPRGRNMKSSDHYQSTFPKLMLWVVSADYLATSKPSLAELYSSASAIQNLASPSSGQRACPTALLIVWQDSQTVIAAFAIASARCPVVSFL
jgi:hypothetical protein